MILLSKTPFGRFLERIELFWDNWDLLIICAVFLVVWVYYVVRWFLWRFPDFFFERVDND